MEILLIACMLAYAAGAQSEQSKLGVSPAQRATMREKTRHAKAIRRIAEKHGTNSPDERTQNTSPWKEAPAPEPTRTLSEAFRSGYRGHTRVQRVATPVGRRAGEWTAQGVAWGRDTGRGALRAYRKRRRRDGYQDPAPIVVPIPAEPPTVGANGGSGEGVSLKKPDAAPEEPSEQPPGKPAEPPEVGEPETPTLAEPQPVDQPDATLGGVGRMAAEVTYESVTEESDELSIMCEDDVRVYDRIRERAEREIGRGDTLTAAMQDAGFGPKVIGWVSRCKENYGVIHSEVDDLQRNTIAQGEAVVKAKALLEAGQGVYADIAQGMEDVAEREAYISDAVDAEDTQAHSEVYETKAA